MDCVRWAMDFLFPFPAELEAMAPPVRAVTAWLFVRTVPQYSTTVQYVLRTAR